ncbi:hypothetical protein Pelo_4607 [Pelomyxa schiedti]|nr:hypothetical protein Pelo_4607 [Pelomyxa schiedti]
MRTDRKKGFLAIGIAPPGLSEEENKAFEAWTYVFGSNNFALGSVPIVIMPNMDSIHIANSISQACNKLKRGSIVSILPLLKELSPFLGATTGKPSKKVLVICGSKNPRGTTVFLSQYAKQFICQKFPQIQVEIAQAREDPAKVALAAKDADTILFCFPLYIYACPAYDIDIMEKIAADGPRPDLTVVAIGHLALYETELTFPALCSLHLWTLYLKATWAGYITGAIPPGALKPQTTEKFDEAITQVITGKPMPASYWTYPVAKSLWCHIVNWTIAAEYGVLHLMRNPQPYARTSAGKPPPSLTPRSMTMYIYAFKVELVLLVLLLSFVLYKLFLS